MARASKHSPQQDFISRGRHHSRICSINRVVALLFLATVIVAVMVMMGESPKPAPEYIKYSTVTDYFQQDDHNTDDKNFDYTISNFGLIDRSYDSDPHADPHKTKTQWERFEHEVARLNQESGSKTQYKVLYLGRHGEGYHNVAEAFYGTRDWDCYWSLQNGNETSTWVDARLTPIGIAQAQKANAFWHLMISIQKIPTPESYYTSPLMRCLATAEHTFSGLKLPAHKPFKPLIKELIREAIGAHTCDMRSTKTEIQKAYPDWPIEHGFAEEDPLWDAELRETDQAMDIRLREALDDIFSSDDKTFISISSHSGAIGSILRVLKHRSFSLGTGQVIPVLVRAEMVHGEGPSRAKGPYTTISKCPMPTPATLALLNLEYVCCSSPMHFIANAGHLSLTSVMLVIKV